MTKKRFEYIDLLEAIAILFVLLYHCTTYGYDFLETPSMTNHVRYFLRAGLSTGVPMFFFANGYLLLNKGFDLKKHMKKTLRLIVITIAWGAISAVMVMILNGEELSAKEILKNTWGMNDSWLWFMGTLICIYIFFPLLKTAFDGHRGSFVFFTAVCAIMTMGNKLICGAATVAAHKLIGYPELIRENVFNMFNPFQGIYWYSFVYFCCGGLAHELVPRIKEKQKKYNIASEVTVPLSMMLLTLWGTFVSRLSGEVWDIVWGGYDTVFTFVNVCALFVLCLNYEPGSMRIKRIIETVSVNTIGIYFLHELYNFTFAANVRAIPAAQNPVGNIVYALCVMLMSLISIWIIKKIPIVKKLLA